MRVVRACAVAIAAFAWAASCTFKPDLSRYEGCDAGGSCSAGYQCLVSEQICIPSCADPPLCGQDAGPDAGPIELSVNPETFPLATELRPYRVDLVADGGVGPYSFREAPPPSPPLPPGLQLDDAGVLSGTPQNAGFYQVRVQVEDRSSPPITSTVQRGLPVRALLRVAGPATLANAASGQPYTESLSATGGDGGYRFRIADGGDEPPQGLVLAENGDITGTTSDSGAAAFDVEVVDGDDPAQVAVQRVSMNVILLPITLQFATRSLPDGRLGTPYVYQLQRLPKGSGSTWSLPAGSLPLGVGLDTNTGVISGVPVIRGRFTCTIGLSDGISSVQATFTMDVL